MPVHALGLGAAPAKAQTFIENILKRDAQKAQARKKQASGKKQTRRTEQKRSKSKIQSKPAASSASPSSQSVAVPIPVPEQKPDQPAPVQPADDKTDPVPVKPEEKPARQNTEPRVNAPEKSDDKPADNKQAEKSAKDERVYQVACPALIAGEVEGKLLPPINDDAQCGVHSPLLLSAIGKEQPLKFTNPVTTNCAMAVTLAQWSIEVNKAVRDVYGKDIKISEIGTGSDYKCRKVNGASRGRVSEHAFANALDIMSFTLSDGSQTQLESGWQGSDKEKAFWRAVHGASCKMFMTVIGPDGDAAHKTNMHLDQGCHGKTCLTRLCQ
ncbi:extensin family protein [Brucella sp. BE17]|uniref:extensin family protein n=1 Tax=Brucella sp. BE17 TaxID=3142977 RepID=UPI0031B9CED3